MAALFWSNYKLDNATFAEAGFLLRSLQSSLGQHIAHIVSELSQYLLYQLRILSSSIRRLLECAPVCTFDLHVGTLKQQLIHRFYFPKHLQTVKHFMQCLRAEYIQQSLITSSRSPLIRSLIWFSSSQYSLRLHTRITYVIGSKIFGAYPVCPLPNLWLEQNV